MSVVTRFRGNAGVVIGYRNKIGWSREPGFRGAAAARAAFARLVSVSVSEAVRLCWKNISSVVIHYRAYAGGVAQGEMEVALHTSSAGLGGALGAAPFLCPT